MARVEVSVVLPVLDEVESLGVLYRELTEVLEGLGRSGRKELLASLDHEPEPLPPRTT